ncbi:MAG: hypothetical protein GEV28_28060 [Actinophytocola sp.]|uniref:hypothetical protein n=1 Tax=Actinophytocola sp. TaxID=1872138 RepID=UPI00132A7766|nr:hypothetical protein [Actinophytocola sp.]MPZ84040.1 hypothetical protein [Actinophytocola sp.]
MKSVVPSGQQPQPKEINIYSDMVVSSWVKIREGCPITLDLVGDEVHVQFGDNARTGSSEIILDVEAFREVMRLGGNAMREFDETHAHEDDEREESAA